MDKPNFFIVGAPKCGTTALYTFLRRHPDIFMPDRKEPHFFGKDLNFTRRAKPITDLNEYLALFQPGEGKKRLGEASTWYLYSKTAAKEIKAFSPLAFIIIMLRNPVESLYSGYYQRRFAGSETAPTFEAALELETERKRGKNIPPNVLLIDALYYSENALYTDMVRRYFDVFGRERVHVIIHDDMLADLAAVYRVTLQFLEVDPEFRPSFQIVNPNKEIRSRMLHSLLEKPPRWYQRVQAVGRALVPADIRKSVNLQIKNANVRYTQRPPMNPNTRRELQAYFRPDVERLSELLGRDLTHWCE